MHTVETEDREFVNPGDRNRSLESSVAKPSMYASIADSDISYVLLSMIDAITILSKFGGQGAVVSNRAQSGGGPSVAICHSREWIVAATAALTTKYL